MLSAAKHLASIDERRRSFAALRMTLLGILILTGCASKHSTPGQSASGVPDSSSATKQPTTRPILYHRTGGYAGTDDHVVIWPDGLVQVHGELLAPATTTLPPQRITDLSKMFDGWSKLNDEYRAGNIMDAYVITIDYGGKSVTVDDAAPDLPAQFRKIFAEIEAIAAQAASAPPAPAPAGP